MVRKGGLLLKKAAIILKTLVDMNHAYSQKGLCHDRSSAEEEIALRTLEAKLRDIEPGRDIRTCSDFIHLQAECCEICHGLSPHYEMALLDMEGGGKAWICCALDRALNPQKHAQFASSAAYKTLAAIFSLIDYDE